MLKQEMLRLESLCREERGQLPDLFEMALYLAMLDGEPTHE